MGRRDGGLGVQTGVQLWKNNKTGLWFDLNVGFEQWISQSFSASLPRPIFRISNSRRVLSSSSASSPSLPNTLYQTWNKHSYVSPDLFARNLFISTGNAVDQHFVGRRIDFKVLWRATH